MIEGSVGRWVRASDYELVVTGRGAHVRPTADATFEAYDPWDERAGDLRLDRSASATRRPKNPPYASLVNLLDDCPELERARGAMVPTLSRDAERALLGWCRRYGLLGLTLHEVRSVTPPARFEADEGTAGGPLFPVLRSWYWAAGAWQLREARQYGQWAYTPEDGDEPDARLLKQDMYPPDWPQPHVEYRPLMGADFMKWTSAPFDRWRDAFEPLSARPSTGYEYPSPGSGRFWSDYGERLGDFLNAIYYLKDVLQAAESHKRESRSDAPRIAAFFNRFLDRVHPVISPSAKGWETRYAAPSLLGMLAMMARDDLAGCSLRRCLSIPDCGRIFRSTAQSVTYCSDQCRSREAKRKKARAKGGR